MGVFLESREIEAANRYISAVKKILNNNPNMKFDVCKKCRGTGIAARAGSEYWNGEFCEECKGYSIKLEKNGAYEKCSKCDGLGRIRNAYEFCPKCNGYGYLDWLENITGLRNK